ncbi:hypothetical protein PG999_003098 [Apiospora kogelbergensis]|uniref:Ferric reductase n=1 Tax=Apiospora kogelbergensis TaxID=1337665 RepID=A0AAW0RA83_9PEZI
MAERFGRVLAHLESPALGTHHAVSFLGLGFVPTRGQALFLIYLWIINIALSTVAYPSSASKEELASLLGHRVGLFSFVNLALAVLYASRNNMLLYLTNWTHPTFLVLHRWTAVIAVFQALIHSAIYLHGYQDVIFESTEILHSRYWIWGVAALTAMLLLIPTSSLPLRRRFYEAFLASHIVLSVLVLVGSILHIFYRYGWRWRYQAWIMVALGVWGFDRLLARPLRLLRAGIREAQISIVDETYLMIEIASVKAEGYVYLYFPSLSWRVWESHPFSVAAVSCPARVGSSIDPGSGTALPELTEKNRVSSKQFRTNIPGDSCTPGIVFFVRQKGGLTSKLRRHAGDGQRPKVLVESSYGTGMCLFRHRPHSVTCSKYPNLVCIAGGVGITAVLPLIQTGNLLPPVKTELYWGVRNAALVEAVTKVVGQSADLTASKTRWGHADVSILVGKRFELRSVLEGAARRMSGGITFAVCGPPEMADEVRSIVTELGIGGLAVKLHEQSFVG